MAQEKDKSSDPTTIPTKQSPSKGLTNASDARRWLIRVVLHAAILLGTIFLGIVLVGVAQRIGWLKAQQSGSSAPAESGSEQAVYTCPMHPEIRQDEPGKCPICGMTLVVAQQSPKQLPASPVDESRFICPMMCVGPQSEPGKCPVCAMDLVEASSGGNQSGNAGEIASAARRILGIQTAVAKLGTASRTIRTVGSIDYDQQHVATISAYVDGRLEKMLADYVGVTVKKGDDLAVLYSPQLYSAQIEFFSARQSPALNALAGDGDSLTSIAHDNLQELGMSDVQINELRTTGVAKKRLRITSPISGTVTAKHKVEGDYVKTGEPIYRIDDLSTVWLMLDLYPEDAAAVRFGQQVEAEVQSSPGEIYTGRVAFVDPMVNTKTRTVGVRVEITNFDGKLKPGDYATSFIHIPVTSRDEVYDPALAGKWISPRHPQITQAGPGKCPICGEELIPTSDLGYAKEPISDSDVLTIPRDAVLMAGGNSVVYVESEPGLFEIRSVTLGPLTASEAVILDGLKPNEIVATEGNFLIDSQMQLTGNPSLIDPGRKNPSGQQSANPPASPPAAHQH